MKVALLIGVAVTIVTAAVLTMRRRSAERVSDDWLEQQARDEEHAGWPDGVPWRTPVAAETRDGFARIAQREWKRGA